MLWSKKYHTRPPPAANNLVVKVVWNNWETRVFLTPLLLPSALCPSHLSPSFRHVHTHASASLFVTFCGEVCLQRNQFFFLLCLLIERG